MSDSRSTAAADALIRVRKERVHTTMLIELLALLIFLAMGFAFLSREEKSVDRLTLRNEELKAELAAKDAQIAAIEREARDLRTQNELLAESLRRFQSEHGGTLVANDRVILSRRHFQEMAADIRNKDAIIRATQANNAALLRRIGRGGSDLPPCPVTDRFIVAVELMGDGGFVVRPAWGADAAMAVAAVPGATALASSRAINRAEFQRLAGQMKQWGSAQRPPCGFRASIRRRHQNADLNDRQRNFVAQYFYIPH